MIKKESAFIPGDEDIRPSTDFEGLSNLYATLARLGGFTHGFTGEYLKVSAYARIRAKKIEEDQLQSPDSPL